MGCRERVKENSLQPQNQGGGIHIQLTEKKDKIKNVSKDLLLYEHPVYETGGILRELDRPGG
ncbi:hypothetical protein X474_27335 [Dethiosulfatarculus sandiegensis]|uniref:Uncharacterized protein n=1 Tax=Dethiosulfatarculus sandiegensis TaxID=1429043 RepID=A0A0D2J5S2_9BACT|nr:hypothetical protein X474_27335 [Dethiosulfatarculus sandiegensis]